MLPFSSAPAPAEDKAGKTQEEEEAGEEKGSVEEAGGGGGLAGSPSRAQVLSLLSPLLAQAGASL